MKVTLLAIDAVGIQPFIYSTNVLREIVGASELVSASTQEWPDKILRDLNFLLGTVKDGAKAKVEKIYAGGGNALLVFVDPDDAKKFANEYSKWLLTKAPGLNLVLAKQDFDWTTESLSSKAQELFETLRARKNRREISIPLLGLGVTATCQSSGLPAIEYVPDPGNVRRTASAEVVGKRAYTDHANDRLKADFLRTPSSDSRWDYSFPLDFDKLGRTRGEASYISVVHADGNSLGWRFQQLLDDYKEPEKNRELADAWRKLSDAVNEAGREATGEVVSILVNRCNRDAGTSGSDEPCLIAGEQKILLERDEETTVETGKKKTWFLPIRPLIYGGDDFTFVCDGRLGLSLAALYLEKFRGKMKEEAKTIGLDVSQPSNQMLGFACAGIATVKAHYPFARAYELAEELTKKAKGFARQAAQASGQPAESYGSALDWHFAASGLLGDLDEIRRREFHVSAGCLQMRPVLFDPEYDAWRTWKTFRTLTKNFSDSEAWPRSKLMALREALRQGRDGVKAFVSTLDREGLPAVAGVSDAHYQESGWSENDQTCVYFDAIEALDFLIDLKE